MVATVTLSMEVELAWGQADGNNTDAGLFSDGRKQETDTLKSLLSYCDELDLPISFDVVGHLLENSCSGSHEGPHKPGWFTNDPGSNAESSPLFYAPDLVEMIRSAETNHEICTHSYSHVLGNEIDAEILSWELQTVRKLWRIHGLPSPISYVPPRHESPHIKTLSENGITAVRMPIDDISFSEGPLRSYIQRHRLTIPDVPPEDEYGVIKTYSTPFPSLSSGALANGQRLPPKILQLIPVTLRQYLHRRWLMKQTRAAIERNGHLHLWTHLFNISNKSQIKPLFKYLSWLAELRNDETVNVKTMSQLGTGVGETTYG